MHIVTLGELLIDMFPAEIGRRLADVTAFYPKPGGAPANVAVAARRLGVDTAFIGKVGDDAFGHYLIEVMGQQGVDTRGMRVDHDARTTMAVIALPDEHTAEYVFYRNPGADQRLHPDDLDLDLLRSARALHFGSLSLSDEPSRSATYQAVHSACEAGTLVSYDVNYRPSLWQSPDHAVAQIAAMIPNVDLLKVNEIEIDLLVGGQRLEVGMLRAEGRDQRSGIDILAEKAARLLEMGPELVVVTLGAEGSYFQFDRGSGLVPPFPVETVDAVGCGDAFIAGVLTQLTYAENWRANLSPHRLSEILQYANAVGALTATKQGVIPALPTSAEVNAFLSDSAL
ncbi:MAG: carbohydrate kinase [Chloroflexi bacterium]|nr:carbohydrate kinase [Chloroflexota bacterium]